MYLIRNFVYWLGFRPKRGIFFSPSRDLAYKMAAVDFEKIFNTKENDDVST